MNVSKEVKAQKEMFAFNYWKDSKQDGNAQKIDAQIKAKFGHGLGLRRLYEIRKDALKDAAIAAPKMPLRRRGGRGPGQVVQLRGRRTCPKCHKSKDIVKDFGLRTMPNGQKRPQVYCSTCRKEYSKQRYLAKRAAEAPGAVIERRGRGRPRKNPIAGTPTISAPTASTVTDASTPAHISGVAPADAVLVATNALLNAMRQNRVEAISIHSNGTTSIKVLEAKSAEYHFGGRRASDPAPTVSLPN